MGTKNLNLKSLILEVNFFDKARVQQHKKGIENSPKVRMSYRFQFMSSAHIYIIKKRKNKYKKELGGHKPNPVNPQSVCQPKRVIQRNKNNTGGCLTGGVWTNRQHGMNPRTNNPLRQQQA